MFAGVSISFAVCVKFQAKLRSVESEKEAQMYVSPEVGSESICCTKGMSQ